MESQELSKRVVTRPKLTSYDRLGGGSGGDDKRTTGKAKTVKNAKPVLKKTVTRAASVVPPSKARAADTYTTNIHSLLSLEPSWQQRYHPQYPAVPAVLLFLPVVIDNWICIMTLR